MKKSFFVYQLFMKFYNLMSNLLSINTQKLDKPLKRKLIKAYLHSFDINRFDSKSKQANIAGYKIQYCTVNSLKILFNEIFIKQEYYFSTNTDKPFIIDCGSNIGMSVIYFKMLYPQSKIIAFEPDQDAYLCLKNNILINELKNIEFHQKALSNKEGNITFFIDQENPGSLLMSTIRERMPKQELNVPCTLLSKYIEQDVDFIKIDIEGSEKEVLEDLYKNNKLALVKQMAIEYHHHILKDKDELSRILYILENSGFGYQIDSSLSKPLISRQFQDILIYAYQKKFQRI